tara:strand:+ start:964 stop:1971 length:1008 start_codon:yes stop_codon:yes gene_type:complete
MAFYTWGDTTVSIDAEMKRLEQYHEKRGSGVVFWRVMVLPVAPTIDGQRQKKWCIRVYPLVSGKRSDFRMLTHDEDGEQRDHMYFDTPSEASFFVRDNLWRKGRLTYLFDWYEEPILDVRVVHVSEIYDKHVERPENGYALEYLSGKTGLWEVARGPNGTIIFPTMDECYAALDEYGYKVGKYPLGVEEILNLESNYNYDGNTYTGKRLMELLGEFFNSPDYDNNGGAVRTFTKDYELLDDILRHIIRIKYGNGYTGDGLLWVLRDNHKHRPFADYVGEDVFRSFNNDPDNLPDIHDLFEEIQHSSFVIDTMKTRIDRAVEISRFLKKENQKAAE